MKKMKLGAEPGKVVILAGLLAAAGYLFWTNAMSGPPAPEPSAPAPAAVKAPARPPEAAPRRAPAPNAAAAKNSKGEFRPSLRRRPGDEAGLLDADPALRTGLLARLASVQIGSIERSLFDFGPADPPKAKLPEPKIAVANGPQKMIGPEPPPPPPPPPVKPPPPPIPLKFYGNALPADGRKRVFCLQSDDVLAPAEGDLILKRYRIVKIETSTVVVEDTEHKHQQTLPIEQPPPAG
jgi:hypothetical protein